MVLPFLVAESFLADDRGFLLSLERPLFGMATLLDSYLILNNDCQLLELEGWVWPRDGQWSFRSGMATEK